MTKYTFTESQVRDAASKSSTKTEMMTLLKIKQSGGGYQALESWCRKFGVEPPNHSSNRLQDSLGRKVARTEMPPEEWFVNGVKRNGQASRRKLIRLGVPNECVVCHLGDEWNGKPLTLQLDHINGDRFDNRLDNLRIICPNCHTQTETYANTGAKKRRYYCECGKEIWRGSSSCLKCSQRNGTIGNYPEIEYIVTGIMESNYTQYAKTLGVSGNAVRKYLRNRGVDPKTLTCQIKS